MGKGRVIIIFSGYNNRAVISFIRTLEKNRIDYVVIARNSADPILRTAYKNKVVLTRENQTLDLNMVKEHIRVINNNYKVAQYFIAPSTEALNRFLLKEHSALEEMNVQVPLVDNSVYVPVSDKKEFGGICQNNGILVPSEYKSFAHANLPFVVKPKRYYSQDGSVHTPFLIFENGQKESFLDKCSEGDFYFQEYVEGRSIYLLFYFHRNGSIFKFSQENLVQQPNGGSIVAAVSSDFHNTSESKKYERLFKSFGYFGLVMVELKVNNDKFYMIEANPRFWGPSQLFVDAGMNFFEAFLHDYSFIENAPTFEDPIDVEYFWFGGIRDTYKVKGELLFHKGCERELMLNLDDWIRHDIFRRSDTIDVFREDIK